VEEDRHRCTDYNPQWLGMLDCYGVISIWQPDNSGYPVQNNTQSGPIIAQINSARDFVVQNNEMYLIDITPKSACNNATPGKYCGSFQTNDKSKTYYYDYPNQVNQVPVYLEHFSIRLGVSRVREISVAFLFGDTFEKRGDCSPKLLNGARLHFA
jgi:hypothetical protein